MSAGTLDITRLLGARRAKWSDEAVSHLTHALQCAALAREQKAGDEVVLAALLHDIGHLVRSADESAHDHHGIWGARYIRPFVPPRVAQLVEHHVVAKRYLCTVDRAYAESLSPVSLRSWLVQGGRLDVATLRDVERQPWLADALRIRCWDDLAKDPRAEVPPLDAYRDLIEPCFGAQSWGSPDSSEPP
jgi:[1-hydroxy-2-(trimethylamino)ethyl]phosphonate dioxygenase